jgi:hypothetical protein
MKFLCAVCLLLASSLSAGALDREAFTFTRYDLHISLDPSQQRLGARGTITLRNDSDAPQSSLTLQISSSLHWVSIQAGGKPAGFITQAYTSDIDHTGALSEAIVSLPKPIAAKATLEISVGYEGTIPQDATRLTRIGMSSEAAKHSDWDQIGAAFTAVRGIGYVAWYPIAMESVNMSDPSALSEAVGRWKERERGTEMSLDFSRIYSGESGWPSLFCNGEPASESVSDESLDGVHKNQSKCVFQLDNGATPLFVIGNYQTLDSSGAKIAFLPEHKPGADDYVLALNQVAPSVSVWLGGHTSPNGTKRRVIDLPDAKSTPFESGSTLLMPLTGDETNMLLMGVQQTAQLDFASPRPWISSGLARYAQARYVEQEKNRELALSYLQSHSGALVEAERLNVAQGSDAAARNSLIRSSDEFYVETKAMNVWWMLRDLVGETAFAAALHNYKAADDKDAMHMQKLLEAQSHRDLTWFFNDWVYRDGGLPDFRIASVFFSPIVSGGNMVTVTVENLGAAAAEVPVRLVMAAGDATEKLIVPGKSKASVRILAASTPEKAIVNDGSVPESDTSNNEYQIDSASQ